MKRCSRCCQEKPLIEFHRNANNRDGRTTYCKACMSEYAHRRYEANKERIKVRERDRRRTQSETWKKNQLRKQQERELAARGMKKCIRCGEIKSHNEFHNNANAKDGKVSWCKKCRTKYKHERYKAAKNRHRKWSRIGALRRNFGITVLEYDEMLEKQGGVCAICGKSPKENGRRLAVDHDHGADEVRGLLCTNCNLAIGYLSDDPMLALSASKYLLGWQKMEIETT